MSVATHCARQVLALAPSRGRVLGARAAPDCREGEPTKVRAETSKFYSSTIAFNTANLAGATEGTGVFLDANYALDTSVILESTLISNNGNASTESDLGAFVGAGITVTINPGLVAAPANNLIRATSTAGLPSDTSHACPLLGPLRESGGVTQTHALLSHSPAIDAGNDYFQAT